MVSNSACSSAVAEAPISDAVGYRVEVLSEARPTEAGVVHRSGERTVLLEWCRVRRAVAAEVGEPQGVRTIVFDLVLETDGAEAIVCRFDADPSDNAMAIARAIAASLPPDRTEASIKILASEGTATRWYPDLESFEEAHHGGRGRAPRLDGAR
jgi:hypothetical protein